MYPLRLNLTKSAVFESGLPGFTKVWHALRRFRRQMRRVDRYLGLTGKEKGTDLVPFW
jgi:hypothetical protein